MTNFLVVFCLCMFGVSSISIPFLEVFFNGDDLRQCKEKVNELNIAVADLRNERRQAEGKLSTCTWDLKVAKKDNSANALLLSELQLEIARLAKKTVTVASQLSKSKQERLESHANIKSQLSKLVQDAKADFVTTASQLSELERTCVTKALQLFNEKQAVEAKLVTQLSKLKNEKQEVEANLATYRKSFRCDPTSLTPYSFIATMNVSSSKLNLFIHTSGSHKANFNFFSQRNPGPIVGAVGQFNDGKTFLINGISCQATRFAEGVDISTPGISVSRVVCEDGATFVLMDTAGLREAMKDDSGEGPVQDQLYTDLMLRMVDSYVLVVQEFTSPNQYFLDYVRTKLSRDVRVSVVHNFKHCTDQGQMESLANRTIRRVYPNATKQKLFFLDPQGAPHYILGQNGSNPKITATNRRIFEHIRDNIDEIPPRPESIRERFEAAVSALLPPYLVQRDREASTTPIPELLETDACEPLRWTENNETLNELLRSPYKCSKVLQFSWPGAVLSLNKSSLQSGFLGVQKKDLLPRYVDYFTEERTKLAGLMMDLPGCDITMDRSGSVMCHRNEVGATGALPSGWDRLSADNVEQMRFMDQNEFILCNRHEYENGVLKLFYYRKRERQEYLLCGDEPSFNTPFIALLVAVSIVLGATIVMAYRCLYPAYRAWRLSRDWDKCQKEICDSFHRDLDLVKLKKITEKYNECTKDYLEFVRARMAPAYAQAANPNAITAKVAKQPLIPGDSLDERIDYMRNIAAKQGLAFEQLLTRLVGSQRLDVRTEVAPIKSKDRMIEKASEEHDKAEGHRYITDVNRGRIVCDNIDVMLRLMTNFFRLMATSNGDYVFYQEKNLFGTNSSAPPCVLLKIGLPYNKKNLNNLNSQVEKKTLDTSRQGNDLSDKEYWIVELQLTFKAIKEVAPFCHTLYEVTRAKELPMRCPGCGLLRLSSSEHEMKHLTHS